MDAPTRVVQWLLEVLLGTNNYQWFIQNDPMTYYIIVACACGMILATVAFAFKFLLKLVD